MDNNTLKQIGLVVGGIIIGGGTTFLVLNKRMEDKLEVLLDLETAKIRNHYEEKYKDEPGDKQDGAEEEPVETKQAKKMRTAREKDLMRLRQQLAGNGYVSKEDEEDMDEKLDNQKDAPGILVNDGGELRTTDPNDDRDPTRPYVINIVEYNEEHEEYEKQTITWYAGDQTLADEDEEVIPDIERTVGSDALTRFGDGSQDKNIVYVRNDRIAVDFEVVYEEGGYAALILGILPEKEPIRKMRDGD